MGVITSDERAEGIKQEAYACDITYGQNNEFGFDYLRDNMKVSPEQMVQRPLNYALIDEVDSLLIDEARTPSSSAALLNKRPGSTCRSTRSFHASKRPPLLR